MSQASQVSHVSQVMKQHPEFCNPETRVPDIKYILKKYNYDAIVILDSDHHPIGIVKEEAVSDEAMKKAAHPFDVKAENLMTKIYSTVREDASLQECLNLMESNHLFIVPVVDEKGHCLGIVKKEDLLVKTRQDV